METRLEGTHGSTPVTCKGLWVQSLPYVWQAGWNSRPQSPLLQTGKQVGRGQRRGPAS